MNMQSQYDLWRASRGKQAAGKRLTQLTRAEA
jgi:plasmid maintenance system antidote protein VapI